MTESKAASATKKDTGTAIKNITNIPVNAINLAALRLKFV